MNPIVVTALLVLFGIAGVIGFAAAKYKGTASCLALVTTFMLYLLLGMIGTWPTEATALISKYIYTLHPDVNDRDVRVIIGLAWIAVVLPLVVSTGAFAMYVIEPWGQRRRAKKV